MSLFEIILCIVLAPFAILATAVSLALLTGIGVLIAGVWSDIKNGGGK